MELYFLGTGAGAPAKGRNVSALALRFDQGRAVWLFDAGEGTQRQLLESPFSAAQIEHIWITHMHGDHIFGLPGLLASRSLQSREAGPLTVTGPRGLRAYIDACLRSSGTRLGFALTVRELDVEDGAEPRAIHEDDAVTVSCLPLRHGIVSFGFAVCEKPRPGRFRVEAARALGVPEGPLFGRLKRGEPVTLADGRVVSGADLSEPPRQGRKLAVLGDTAPCEAAVRLAERACAVVHEATFAGAEANLARARLHCTAADAARTAAAAGAEALLLTHISPRYPEGSPALDGLRREAQAIFPGAILARDHLSYSLPHP